MRLTAIFNYLSKDGLDIPLKKWFKNAYSTLVGRIVSLHFTKELHLASWGDHEFGFNFSQEFSSFLSKHSPDGDAAYLAKEFCISNQNFRFFGSDCKSFGSIVSVVRLEHIIKSIGEKDRGKRYINLLTNADDKCQEVGRLLKKHKVSMANEGITWLTIYENGIDKIQFAKKACDLLGKNYTPPYYYLVLRTRDVNRLNRPTIGDGNMNFQFRPYCDSMGWGLTLTKSSFEKGLPEAIKKETEEILHLIKYLKPSKSGIVRHDYVLRNYFNLEKKRFMKESKSAFEDLKNAWN
jgi:hypothetical protein